MHGVDDLLRIMRDLRDPDHGCPWDLRQDFRTIAPYTVEEAYEVSDAIEREAWDELRGELGDLLLQVVYHAQMAEEQDLFCFSDVVEAICSKMVERHPHVFGEVGQRSEDEIKEDWEKRKHRERAEYGMSGVLGGIPKAQPALTRAFKLQKRAARVGFDWEEARQVEDKIEEELCELREAKDSEERAAEIGDLLFTLVNYARHCDFRPEETLHRACSRFTRRFEHMEACLEESGEAVEGVSAERWEKLWEGAKRAEV